MDRPLAVLVFVCALGSTGCAGAAYEEAASLRHNTCEIPDDKDEALAEAMDRIVAEGFDLVEIEDSWWFTDYKRRAVLVGAKRVTPAPAWHEHTHVLQETRSGLGWLSGTENFGWAIEVQAHRQSVITLLHQGYSFDRVAKAMREELLVYQEMFDWTAEQVADAEDLVIRDDWCEIMAEEGRR